MNKFYLYTETAYHHQGDMIFIKELIDASKTSGANGVKFQVMTKTSDFISTKHKAFEQLNDYCFNLKEWEEIFEYTLNQELDIIMMPLNTEAFQLINKFKIKYLDIHSVSFYDEAIISKVKESNLDIILAVGGRTLGEIKDKAAYFGNKLKVLMTGFQSFPSKLEEVKIGKITHLKNMFPNILIGYADHSAFDHDFAVRSNEYAALLGATVFEKHITTLEGVERVDFNSAVSPEKIREIVDRLTFINQYINTDFETSFSFEESEKVYRDRQVRCVAKSDIDAGTKITQEHILLKLVHNPENSFSRIEELIGKVTSKKVTFDEVFNSENIIL